jgi:hypothetical protein
VSALRWLLLPLLFPVAWIAAEVQGARFRRRARRGLIGDGGCYGHEGD